MHTALRTIFIMIALGLIGWGLFTGEDLSDARWLAMLFGAWVFLLLGTRIPLPSSMPTFNHSLIRTALVITTVFIVISAQLVRVQVVARDDIYYKTAIAPDGEIISNPRLTASKLNSQRGQIVDRNGVVLADTRQEDGTYIRYWPVPSTYGVTGYYSPLMYGATGLEGSWQRELSGETGTNAIEHTIRSLLGMPQQGANLHLTLDSYLQTSAMQMLNGSTGAVVVLDIKTGETIVLASNPTVDPNQLFTTGTDPEAATYWQTLLDDPETPLVTRANIGLYTPGSTFKTVTAGIAIEEGYAQPDTVYTDDGFLDIDGRILPEYNRPDDTRDQWTLADGIAWSLNVVFAQIGLQIGGETYWQDAPHFGFGEEIPFDLPVSQSQIANNRGALSDRNTVADTGFGQGQIQITPLQLAMIAAMWANDGEMMRPYLVDSVSSPSGSTVRTTSPKVWKSPVSAETAGKVRDMMVNAVDNGSIQNAKVGGYVIGGKTGTAETSDDRAHSLFIGFIGDPEPRYAVAVVLEGGYGGENSATAIGRDILVATIERRP
ncbi:MAG TPA: penicillin-binding protein 2 [Thermomicrobiales bacterium]|nr:penicillin-binding protein 2 [Thermomicrobiales bacterium]